MSAAMRVMLSITSSHAGDRGWQQVLEDTGTGSVSFASQPPLNRRDRRHAQEVGWLRVGSGGPSYCVSWYALRGLNEVS